MAPTNHLQRRRISEFGGLWDNGSLTQMPANAARVMSGCHPQAGGGLRAFHAPKPWYFANPGVSHTGTFRIVGIISSSWERVIITASVNTGIPAVAGAARPLNQSTPNTKFHHANAAATTSPTYSALSLASSDLTEYTFPLNPAAAQPIPLDPVSSPWPTRTNTYFTAGQAITTGSGAPAMLHLDHGTPTLSKTTPSSNTLVTAIHQSRLVCSYGPSVVFSTPGINDVPSGFLSSTAQFVHLGGSNVSWLAPTPPADLLVGTADGGVYNIQGDLSDPIVRTLRAPGSGQCRSCVTALSSRGAVVDLGEGPVLMDTSGEAHPIYDALRPEHWGVFLPASAGPEITEDALTLYRPHYAVDGPYIYARGDTELANMWAIRQNTSWITDYDTDDLDEWVSDNELQLNGSLVFDTETQAWFRSAHPDVAEIPAPWLHQTTVGVPWTTERQRNGVITVPSEEHTGSASGDWAWIQSMQNPRAHTYEWLSAPLHVDSGRQVELKEVQFGAATHVPSNTFATDTAGSELPEGVPDPSEPSTITVYAVNEHGQTDSVAVPIQPGPPRVYTATLRMTGTYVSVGVKAASPHVDLEAPSIEYIDLGYTEGSTIYMKPAP